MKNLCFAVSSQLVVDFLEDYIRCSYEHFGLHQGLRYYQGFDFKSLRVSIYIHAYLLRVSNIIETRSNKHSHKSSGWWEPFWSSFSRHTT